MSLVSAQKFTHGRFCAREATVVRAALPAGASRCTARGSMLLELCAALALVAAAAAALLGGLRPLGDHTSITAGPSDGSVAFRGTGLADNGTVSIACGSATASVVVNQRGVVR